MISCCGLQCFRYISQITNSSNNKRKNQKTSNESTSLLGGERVPSLASTHNSFTSENTSSEARSSEDESKEAITPTSTKSNRYLRSIEKLNESLKSTHLDSSQLGDIQSVSDALTEHGKKKLVKRTPLDKNDFKSNRSDIFSIINKMEYDIRQATSDSQQHKVKMIKDKIKNLINKLKPTMTNLEDIEDEPIPFLEKITNNLVELTKIKQNIRDIDADMQEMMGPDPYNKASKRKCDRNIELLNIYQQNYDDIEDKLKQELSKWYEINWECYLQKKHVETLFLIGIYINHIRNELDKSNLIDSENIGIYELAESFINKAREQYDKNKIPKNELTF